MPRRKAAEKQEPEATSEPEERQSEEDEPMDSEEEAPPPKRGTKRGKAAPKATKVAEKPKAKAVKSKAAPKASSSKAKRTADEAEVQEGPSTSRSKQKKPEVEAAEPKTSSARGKKAAKAAETAEVPPPPPSARGKRKVPAKPEEEPQPSTSSEAAVSSPALAVATSGVKKARLTPKPAELVPYTGPPVASEGLEPHGGTLITWGMGEMGQLGLGPGVLEKRRPARVQSGTKYTHLSCAGIFTLAVEAAGDSDGNDAKSKIVSMGCNDEYALGRKADEEEESFVPDKVDLSSVPSPFKLAKLVGGDTHGAALTQDGRVFVWGTIRGEEGKMGLIEYRQVQKVPIELDLTKTAKRKGNVVDESRFIVDIASGAQHLIMLSRNGRVYTMGGFYGGQLGRLSARFLDSKKETHIRDAIAPKEVTFALKMKKGKQVFDAVFATTAGSFFREKGTGKLFACGLNKFGQLGVTPEEGRTTEHGLEPYFVPCDMINDFVAQNDPGCVWVKITGGRDFSVLLADNGKAYAIGQYFFLGVGNGDGVDLKGEGDLRYSPVPILLNSRFPDDAEDGRVVDIGAGDSVGLAIVEEPSGDQQPANGNGHANGESEKKRFLISWGQQTMFQLGRNTEDDSLEPELVNLGSVIPLKISVGGQHAGALVKETKQELQ